MKILYPIFAVGLTLNAFWAKRIHGAMGMSFMHLLGVTEHETNELKNMFLTFETIRWNALAGCLLALVMVVFIVSSSTYRWWVKVPVAFLWCVVFILCLSPD